MFTHVSEIVPSVLAGTDALKLPNDFGDGRTPAECALVGSSQCGDCPHCCLFRPGDRERHLVVPWLPLLFCLRHHGRHSHVSFLCLRVGFRSGDAGFGSVPVIAQCKYTVQMHSAQEWRAPGEKGVAKKLTANTLGERILLLAHRKRMSLGKLAAKADVHRNTVSNIINERLVDPPGQETIAAIAEALGVTPEELNPTGSNEAVASSADDAAARRAERLRKSREG